MYGFGGVGLLEVQLSISELSVVGGGGWTKQAHFMVGPGRGPTKINKKLEECRELESNHGNCETRKQF